MNDRESLCCSGWPWTYGPAASASEWLGPQTYAIRLILFQACSIHSDKIIVHLSNVEFLILYKGKGKETGKGKKEKVLFIDLPYPYNTCVRVRAHQNC